MLRLTLPLAGLSSRDVAALCQCSEQRAGEVLRHMRKRGMAAPTGSGSGARWTLAGRAEALRAQMARAAYDRRLARGRAFDAARRAREAEKLDGLADIEPIHLYRPAGSYAPLRVMAPRSVFELGAMA